MINDNKIDLSEIEPGSISIIVKYPARNNIDDMDNAVGPCARCKRPMSRTNEIEFDDWWFGKTADYDNDPPAPICEACVGGIEMCGGSYGGYTFYH